ncbi:Serine/threonine-protein kinase ULK3 [Trichinella nelsoni]|uniref:Serine/threonine-protein kinase ULK3 n=1 Tax=Trichinella nelsoni TaxID=6336 RepID=A0A0V0S023_9BILA|nr:Serine/threonine-protein kinase ULK3 [Trichinella nelsoni]
MNDREVFLSTQSIQVTCRRQFPLNMLIEHWLGLMVTEAEKKDSKSAFSYRRALTSVRKFPAQLHSVDEAKLLLQYFGDKMCMVLKKKLDEFCAEHGEPTLTNVAGYVGKSVGGKLLHRNANRAVSVVKKRRSSAESVEKCSFIPKNRSGAYAILRALYDALNLDNLEWVGTAELQRRAQAYCDQYIGPSTRNQHYTAWMGRKTLIAHGLVESRRGRGNDYRLTGSGKRLAAQLDQMTNVVGSPKASAFVDEQQQHAEMTCESSSCATDSIAMQNHLASQKADPGLEPRSTDWYCCTVCGTRHVLLAADGYDVLMLVDNSETKGGPTGRAGPRSQLQSSKAKMKAALLRAGIDFEERELSVGDYLWLARSKTDSRDEFVLDVIVERKRVDDLANSVLEKEGRYREQKFRLKRCGLKNVVYLVEDFDGMDSMAEYKKLLVRGACAKTQLIDQFHFVRTHNLEETVCCAEQLTVLQRFAEFDLNNRKQKQWTVSEVFARMLLQFHGISAERAQQIVNKYPTVAHLLNAYATAERDIDGNEPTGEIPLLAEIRSGMLGRNLGEKLAKKIQFFFTSTEPFQIMETVKPQPKGYVLSECLGSGSFGTVYKARSSTTQTGGESSRGNYVAVKCILRRQIVRYKESEDNLIAEISLLKKLKHPHIVELVDFSWDLSFIYLILEYCADKDLEELLKKQGHFSESETKQLIRQLASALQYLRSKSIGHFDLKPQNILVACKKPNPVLKLGDFGFARSFSVEDKAVGLRGSLLYMAPEMLLRQQFDPKADLWSVGVILYRCLYGRTPFIGNMQSIRRQLQAVRGSVPLPTTVSLSVDCRDLMIRLLRVDPKQRIEFDHFFSHPFVDMQHYPSAACLARADSYAKMAIAADEAGRVRQAFLLYREALEYYMPCLLCSENVCWNRDDLRDKMCRYLNRAEALKRSLANRDPKTPLTRSTNQVDIARLFSIISVIVISFLLVGQESLYSGKSINSTVHVSELFCEQQPADSNSKITILFVPGLRKFFGTYSVIWGPAAGQ